MVKAQVKTGGRGKAGGVKVAKTPDEAYEARKAILGLDIKGHVVKRCWSPRRAHRQGVLLLGAARPRQPLLPLALLASRAAWRSRSSPSSSPRRSPRSRSTRHRHRHGQGRGRSPSGANFPPSCSTSPPCHREALRGLQGRGRDARRGQPAGPHAGRRDHRPRRQGHARRERRLPPPRATRRSKTRTPPTRSRPRPRRTTSTTSSSTARSASSATARASSCRRSTSSPTPARTTAA